MSASPLPRPAPSATSLSMLNLARGWDPKGWQRLTDLYRPLVLRWCGHAGVQGADADDVAQEVFLTVAERLVGFERADLGSFRGWLRAITRNKIGDHIRRQRGRARGVGGDDQLLHQLPEPGVESADQLREEFRELAGRALDLIRGEFSEANWKAFWGIIVEGKPAADVAAELGVSRCSVYMAKSRFLQRLRDEFGDALDDAGR